jgi:hypothetical protein
MIDRLGRRVRVENAGKGGSARALSPRPVVAPKDLSKSKKGDGYKDQ